MQSTEGNLWLITSPLFSFQIMFMEKSLAFYSLFFAYSHLGFVWGFLCLGFLLVWFFTGLISSYSVVIKEIGQNNFIHEMRKSYLNVYYSHNFQKLPFFCEIRALSKERVLSPHQQVAKALQFIL